MQIGIDDALLSVQTAENVVEMNNGCICCTVRGDLVRSAGAVRYAREAVARFSAALALARASWPGSLLADMLRLPDPRAEEVLGAPRSV
jgi:hypothetical protein